MMTVKNSKIGLVAIVGIVFIAMSYFMLQYGLSSPQNPSPSALRQNQYLTTEEKQILSQKAFNILSPRSRLKKLENYRTFAKTNKTRYPTNQRYVNPYLYGEPTKWIQESSINISEISLGIYEYTNYPNKRPSNQDFEQAWTLYNRSFERAKEKGWFNFSQAKEQGYIKAEGNHWAAVSSNATPEKLGRIYPINPYMLVYYEHPIRDEKILAGIMFKFKEGNTNPGRQVAGPLTIWHNHPVYTEGSATFIKKQIAKGRTNITEVFYKNKYGSVEEWLRNTTLGSEMMHVWFVKHPEGPFGTTPTIPPDNLKKGPHKMSKEKFISYTNKTYYQHRVNPLSPNNPS